MLERPDFNDASVVNQDVDLTEASERLLYHCLDLRGIEQITLDCKDVGSELIQLVLCM